MCESQGEYKAVKSSSPGFTTPTFGSRDGAGPARHVPHPGHRDPAIDPLASRTGDAILCPE
ncbi:hypothetical protein ACWDRB_64200 [Nonomuraea sp. NPDC003707]